MYVLDLKMEDTGFADCKDIDFESVTVNGCALSTDEAKPKRLPKPA